MTDAPLKILFHTWSLGGGGAERVFAVLASGLAARGHDVIFSVESEDDHNGRLISDTVRRFPPTGGRVRTVRELARLIASERPDVSISAISACNLRHAIAATWAGRRHHAIMSYHGHARAEAELSNRIGYWATPVTTRLVARTVAVSDGLRRHIVETWHGAPHNTVRIYNPTLAAEADATPPTEADLVARPPTVVSVGSLQPRKNFSGLIRAFARVTTPDARLVIVGEGLMRGELEAEIRQLGLAGRVSLPGYMAAPWAAYAGARAFAFASREESFGLVIVEALAAGLPVVVTPSDGPVEILDHGRYGTLVAHDDPGAMAAAIDAALAHPGDPAPRLQRAGDFCVPTGIDAYETLFRQVAAEAERRQHGGFASVRPGRSV
ncbi:MAG: glycosyltransferase [Ancalomicrobiaceae bacterium]|nr:glycosyltransferase [Ancalomicrobiaceae bacterium]